MDGSEAAFGKPGGDPSASAIRSLSGVKQTARGDYQTDANDPRRKSATHQYFIPTGPGVFQVSSSVDYNAPFFFAQGRTS